MYANGLILDRIWNTEIRLGHQVNMDSDLLLIININHQILKTIPI